MFLYKIPMYADKQDNRFPIDVAWQRKWSENEVIIYNWRVGEQKSIPTSAAR